MEKELKKNQKRKVGAQVDGLKNSRIKKVQCVGSQPSDCTACRALNTKLDFSGIEDGFFRKSNLFLYVFVIFFLLELDLFSLDLQAFLTFCNHCTICIKKAEHDQVCIYH